MYSEKRDVYESENEYDNIEPKHFVLGFVVVALFCLSLFFFCCITIYRIGLRKWTKYTLNQKERKKEKKLKNFQTNLTNGCSVE